MARCVIDHENYGDRTEFDSVEDAEKAIHDCGGDFVNVRLRCRGKQIVDERGIVVGYEAGVP